MLVSITLGYDLKGNLIHKRQVLKKIRNFLFKLHQTRVKCTQPTLGYYFVTRHSMTIFHPGPLTFGQTGHSVALKTRSLVTLLRRALGSWTLVALALRRQALSRTIPLTSFKLETCLRFKRFGYFLETCVLYVRDLFRYFFIYQMYMFDRFDKLASTGQNLKYRGKKLFSFSLSSLFYKIIFNTGLDGLHYKYCKSDQFKQAGVQNLFGVRHHGF